MIPSSVGSLAFFCSLILSQVSASAQLSAEGGQIVYSSRGSIPISSSVSVSVQVLDMSNPRILANGRYSEYVVGKASQVYQDILENRAVEIFTKSIFSESLFLNAYEELAADMHVNYQVILPSVICNLAEKFAKIASKYNASKTKILLDSAEYKKRSDMVKIIIVFVQESSTNNVNFTDDKALIFLQFMYRFFGSETGGERYGIAIQALYTSLEFKNFSVFYSMLAKYFDPSFIALPVFYLTIRNESMMFLQDTFIEFMKNIYNKIKDLKSLSDKEAYNRHACNLISCMLSCNFNEVFKEMVSELIQYVDIPQLCSSPRFAKSYTDILKKTRLIQSEFLAFMASHIMEESVIMSYMPNNFIDIGSITPQICLNNPKIYDKYFSRLSEEAADRLTLIEQAYSDYSKVISKLGIFDSLEMIFPTMTASILTTNIEVIDEIFPVFPDYFRHNSQDSGSMLIKILDIVPKLVKIALHSSDSDPELQMKRFVFLVKIIKLTTAAFFLIPSVADSFSHVLLLFNMQTSKIQSSELDEIHGTIADIIKKLIEGNNFFKTITQRSILHNYHINLVQDDADEMTNIVLSYNLEVSSNKSFVFAENISTVNKNKIEANPQMVSYVINEIRQFLESYPNPDGLNNFKDGKVVLMARMIINNRIVSKTEGLFLKPILARF